MGGAQPIIEGTLYRGPVLFDGPFSGWTWGKGEVLGQHQSVCKPAKTTCQELHVSYSQNSLMGSYLGDYSGSSIETINVDAMSLD